MPSLPHPTPTKTYIFKMEDSFEKWLKDLCQVEAKFHPTLVEVLEKYQDFKTIQTEGTNENEVKATAEH